jgi:hypothetical protein
MVVAAFLEKDLFFNGLLTVEIFKRKRLRRQWSIRKVDHFRSKRSHWKSHAPMRFWFGS